jgi:DNA polymerase (family X)
MKNSKIIEILENIAVLLELKGESIFKSRAYQKAARSIENLSEDIEKLAAEDRLKEIPGVGEAISKKITEMLNTGHLEYYEKLKAEFPPGINVLMEVPGIGPRTALLLTKELGITGIDDLEIAIEDGRVASLPRMGEKTAQNILHQLKAYRKKKHEQRVSLGIALTAAEALMEEMKSIPGLRRFSLAGSLRRFKETIGDIDLIGTADNPEAAIEAFIRLPAVKELQEKGSTKASVIISNGLQVDLRLLENDSFGSALQYLTGSKQHNVDLRTRAERLGLSLSEYGIVNLSSGELEKYSTEDSFYQRQGLDYIPPEIREGLQEINLAEKHILPHLIELSDIKGDLHLHSDWSDGAVPLETMIAAARDREYQYVAVTDHSQGLGITGGLDIERIHQQINLISELNRKYPDIRIFSGIEVDIRANGTLDIPDKILAELDIVVASVHSSLKQGKDQMTQRIVSAIQNPHVDILGHPTCRLLGERDPVELDMETVFKAAVEYHTALEINAMPSRLDIKDTYISQARQMGIKLVISTDSHQPEHFNFMRFGIGIARRGWCEAKDILNTLPPDKFKTALKT